MFLEVSFDGSEFFEQYVVLQNFEILDVEVSLVVSLKLLLGLAGVDTFEDAEASEVLEGNLHVSDSV